VPVKAGVVKLPAVVVAPDQPPDAVHAVASVDDQVKTDVLPLTIELGVALIVTVGTGVVTTSAGPPVTVTVAEACAVTPLVPTHEIV
jgi:hypothetical protein